MGCGLRIEQTLTERELEICGLIANGLKNNHIAKLLFLAEGTVKNHIMSIYDKLGVQNRAQLAAKYTSEYDRALTDIPDDADIADSSSVAAPPIQYDATLRLIGLGELPETIPLILQESPFIVGRFDVSIGRKQSDFEFAWVTKAVSRRHASIERTESGDFAVVDLDSRAGTYVNEKRIEPGKPCYIRDGDRISFGVAGADYIFSLERPS